MSHLFPILQQLPMTNQSRHYYQQLYESPQRRGSQQNIAYGYNPLQIQLQTQMNNSGLAYMNSHSYSPQVYNPVQPIIIQQSPIRIGYDLSGFENRNQVIYNQPVLHKPNPQKKYYEEFPANYLETLELPKIQNQSDFRSIHQSIKFNESKVASDREQFLARKSSQQYPPYQFIRDKPPPQKQPTMPYSASQSKITPLNLNKMPDQSQSFKQLMQQKAKIPNQTKYVNDLEKFYDIPKQDLQKAKRSYSQKIDMPQKSQFNDQFTEPQSKKSQPDQQKQTKQRNHKSRRSWFQKTRILRINLIFLSLYLRTLKQQIQDKKSKQQQIFKESVGPLIESLNNWLEPVLNPTLLEIVNSQIILSLIQGEDKANEKKKVQVSKILSSMITNLNAQFYPDLITQPFSKILNQIIQPYNFPPWKYFLKFECTRIPFTTSGAMNQLNENQKRSVLLGFLIIRLIVFENLYKAAEFYPDQDNYDQLKKIQINSIIISSVIHECIVQWIEKSVQQIHGQDMSQLKQQLNFLDYPLTEDLNTLMNSRKQFKENILIDKILSSVVVQKYLHRKDGTKEPWYEKFELDLLNLINSFLGRLEKMQQQEKSKIQKQRMIMKMKQHKRIKKQT